MLASLDVHYLDTSATTACILLQNFADYAPFAEFTSSLPLPAPYEPGQFYKRELPCLLHALSPISHPITTLLIDGYVWLDAAHQSPGLGAHLFHALHSQIPVIGIAKTPFASASPIEVRRGASTRPLYITAVGLDPLLAAQHIHSMHGPSRIPTLLKRTDTLCRHPHLRRASN